MALTWATGVRFGRAARRNDRENEAHLSTNTVGGLGQCSGPKTLISMSYLYFYVFSAFRGLLIGSSFWPKCLKFIVTPQPMAETSKCDTERNRLSRSFHNNYYYIFSLNDTSHTVSQINKQVITEYYQENNLCSDNSDLIITSQINIVQMLLRPLDCLTQPSFLPSKLNTLSTCHIR
ncbi:hypothetical protein Hanom_Chr04g00364671 [Helianthus anomalus]